MTRHHTLQTTGFGLLSSLLSAGFLIVFPLSVHAQISEYGTHEVYEHWTYEELFNDLYKFNQQEEALQGREWAIDEQDNQSIDSLSYYCSQGYQDACIELNQIDQRPLQDNEAIQQERDDCEATHLARNLLGGCYDPGVFEEE